MQYIEYIEKSKTWTCPKTGKWKVICVGGGGAGNYHTGGHNTPGTSGSATSFGTYLIAEGGKANYASSLGSNSQICSAMMGYTGIGNNYGELLPYGIAENPSYGYGLGFGGACGSCGFMKVSIIDLTLNETIVCTIGIGGTNSVANTKAGDGVIIVQYLGE